MEGVEGDLPWGSFNQALQKSEEDLAEDEEEQDDKTVLQVLLRPPHFSPALKMDFPELCRKFRCSKFLLPVWFVRLMHGNSTLII